MKYAFVFACLFAVLVSAATEDIVSDVASILENEPEAAKSRFAEVHAPGDVITFRESSSPAGASSSHAAAESSAAEDSEFDGQIAQIEEQMKRTKEQVKESQACAHRLTEQKAELRALQEQLENLNKEKQKQILQGKVDKQMKDLQEINKMTRALRSKFGELKKTQDMIKKKLTGTKSTLNQLEGNADMSADDLSENTKDIVNELNSLQKVQATTLDTAHKKVSKELDKELTKANNVNLQGRAKAGQSSAGEDI